MIADCIFWRLDWEWPLPGAELIEQYAERVDIAARIGSTPDRLFRRNIRQRTKCCLAFWHQATLEKSYDPRIDQDGPVRKVLDLPGFQADLSGIDQRLDNALGPHIINSQGELPD